jgi:fused signal recognition particle receptor
LSPIAIILIVLIAAVALYFVFGRKPTVELPESDEPPALKPKSEPQAKADIGAKTSEAKAPLGAQRTPRDTSSSATSAAESATKADKSGKTSADGSSKPKHDAETSKRVEPTIAPSDVLITPAPNAVELDSSELMSIPPPEVAPANPPAAPRLSRPKDVAGLRKGLVKSRASEGFFGRIKALFTGRKEIDPALADQLEEVLLTSDVGVKTTEQLISRIKEQLSRGELADESVVWSTLRTQALNLVELDGGPLQLSHKPTVVMVVGVNGVGKTTTIGKLASRLSSKGKKVVLAAGDTFRAAAVEQLAVWGKRSGCEVVRGEDGANSGAVIFDAIQRAKEVGADVVLADTAGRLHTKTNLMEELKKISRTMSKAIDGAPHETLLVLDATTGQNASQQAAMFKEALPLTGLVLTKLDGTAKGGVVIGICAEHRVPVRYVGIGERADELRDFHAEEFVEALLGNGSDEATS